MQGKAQIDPTPNEKPDEMVHRNKPKERNRWIAKTKEGDKFKTPQPEQHIPREILKKPAEGVNSITRQALKNAGLLSDEDNNEILNGTNDSIHGRQKDKGSTCGGLE